VAQDFEEENNRRPVPPSSNAPNPQPVKDPSLSSTARYSLASEDIDNLLLKHSFLAGYSREAITHNIDTILKLETTSLKLKNLEKVKDIADRLTQNRDELDSTFYPVGAGRDNRLTVIDPARFLPGLGCLASKTWLESRSAISTKGHKAISTYDMASVGLAGYVTNKGWVEIHNLGSSCMSLKMFSINNCGASSCKKTDDSSSSDELADIVELGEFKCALRALREAMHQVHPWNLSISAIEGFLVQSNFCNSDLEGLDKRASILTSFVDYVLKENSNRWRGRESFITTPQLKGVWESFFGARPQSLLKGAKKGSAPSPKSVLPGQVRKFDPKLAHLYKEDICVNFNLGRCIKAPGTCATRTGRLLRHICNHRPDPTNPTIPCGANHAACYNH